MFGPQIRSATASMTADTAGDEFARRLSAELDRCRPRTRRSAAGSVGGEPGRDAVNMPPLRDDFSERLAARLRQANRDRVGARSSVAALRGPLGRSAASAAPPAPAPADTSVRTDGAEQAVSAQPAEALPRDLGRVVAAWPRLTAQVRGAILSLIERPRG